MIAREGRQRARARLPARGSRSSSPATAAPTRRPSGRARRAPTSCSTSRAAARSARRTPASSARATTIVAFSDANALLEPDALRELVAPFADPRGRLRLRPGPLRQRGGHEPGGPVLALRDGAARVRVAAARASPAATARSTRRARTPTSSSTRSWATTSASRSTSSSAGWRAVYRPTRAGDGEDGPEHRGRVRPQAADDEPRLADRRPGRPARPARLPAALRAA